MSRIDEFGITHNSFYETEEELAIEPRTEEEMIEYKKFIGMPIPEDYDELISCLKSKEEMSESALQMRNQLNYSHYSKEELTRFFCATTVSDYFVQDNQSKCDTGSCVNLSRRGKMKLKRIGRSNK